MPAPRSVERARGDRHSKEIKPAAAVLRGRLAEALGRDRTRSRDTATPSTRPTGRPSPKTRCARSRCKQKRGELGQAEVLRELELLSVM